MTIDGISRLAGRAALAALLCIGSALAGAPAFALPPETLERVVSVLPVREGGPAPDADKRMAPEGSGVSIGAGGLIATAAHVLGKAEKVEVRLADGRVLPAEILGVDDASDIALLRIEAEPPAFEIQPKPQLSERACTVGNAFGLGLSVACGVVSALEVSHAGFNAVEDFIQTDAAANPGSSGGALVSEDGKLIGMVSAIFAAPGGRNGLDGNIGVNFAVSAPLLLRVARDLQEKGKVDYVSAGWKLKPLERSLAARIAGAEIVEVAAGGPADRAGFSKGDVLLSVGARRIRRPSDVVAALALLRPGDTVESAFLRGGRRQTKTMTFGEAAPGAPSKPVQKAARAPEPPRASAEDECRHPKPVCAARFFVFPVSAFVQTGSSVRIGPDLLVTNRHVVGDLAEALVMTPEGERKARVLASDYEGDLALLQVDGLPDGWPVAALDEREPGAGPFFAVGADIARRRTRVFEPGERLRRPQLGDRQSRLHTAAVMRPGVSGGALVDAEGRLVGVAVGGGEGDYEALPIAAVKALLEGREDDDAEETQARLGRAFAECQRGIDAMHDAGEAARKPYKFTETCLDAANPGQLLEAGRMLARVRDLEGAVETHEAAVELTPNSLGARLSLLTSLQLMGEFDDMLPHARWAIEAAPNNPQALRFGVQAGVWGDEEDLAEAAYKKLEALDPVQARAARRFIDDPPERPQPRR